jgi:hypothetical protein
VSTRHELPTHLGTVNKPFLGLAPNLAMTWATHSSHDGGR